MAETCDFPVEDLADPDNIGWVDCGLPLTETCAECGQEPRNQLHGIDFGRGNRISYTTPNHAFAKQFSCSAGHVKEVKP